TYLTSIQVGNVQYGISVNPTLNQVYVADNSFMRNVYIIDSGTNAVVGTIPINLPSNPAPTATAADRVLNRLYVGTEGISTPLPFVSAYNMGSFPPAIPLGSVALNSPFATNIEAMATNSITHMLYVIDTRTLFVFDTTPPTPALVTSVPILSPNEDGLSWVTVDEIHNTIYVVSRNQNGKVFVIDGLVNVVDTVLSTGTDPFAVGVKETNP
ncbi:hypothetical protein, partial [Bacillus sp. 196mf]|uniref:YncE family protein n=1 Tax=Bacillus sp. 196mf TaxID=1761754 RepID=UPI000D8C120F